MNLKVTDMVFFLILLKQRNEKLVRGSVFVGFVFFFFWEGVGFPTISKTGYSLSPFDERLLQISEKRD